MRLGMSGFILLHSANFEGQVETRPTFLSFRKIKDESAIQKSQVPKNTPTAMSLLSKDPRYSRKSRVWKTTERKPIAKITKYFENFICLQEEIFSSFFTPEFDVLSNILSTQESMRRKQDQRLFEFEFLLILLSFRKA